VDAFESLVASLLEREGFWVRSSFKVELTKAEKQAIGRHSSPRWEIDLVAYKGASNELRLVECKSYLDSRGVTRRGFDGSDAVRAARYKLFNEPVLRNVVTTRLTSQLLACGAIAPDPKVTLCLAAAKIATPSDREWLQHHFSASGWLLWDDKAIAAALVQMAAGGYENQVAAVVAKVLLRGRA
jgi:hypothetical protein